MAAWETMRPFRRMTYQEYLQAARSFEAAEPPSAVQIPALESHDCTKLVHYALGLATEALELVCAVKAGKHFDEQRLELSDILWFSALASAELGVDIDESEIINNRAPKQGVFLLADTCEQFASRIKAALIYGSPVKPNDPNEFYWAQLPKQIFLHACAIGDSSLGAGKLMDLNITKLKKRYPTGAFSAGAAINRAEWQAPSPELLAAAKPVQKIVPPTDAPAPDRVIEAQPEKPIGKTPQIVNLINASKPKE